MEADSTFYRALLDSLNDGIYFVDRQMRITYWNRAAESITGYSAEQVCGIRCADKVLMHVDGEGNCLCSGGCPLAASIEDGEPRTAEIFLHHRSGHRLPVLVRTAPVTDESGQIVGGVEVFSDNSRHMAELQRASELERAACIDHLTGLANRRYTEKCLADRLQEHERYGWPFGVGFVDLNGFKLVNDSHGHDVGDRLLRVVARVLESNLRTFDIAGRWGGDEFVLVLANVDEEQLEAISQRLRCLIRESTVEIAGQVLHPTASIGYSLARPGDSVESIIRRADADMYREKAASHDGGDQVPVVLTSGRSLDQS